MLLRTIDVSWEACSESLPELKRDIDGENELGGAEVDFLLESTDSREELRTRGVVFVFLHLGAVS